jgi:hypothetical protein
VEDFLDEYGYVALMGTFFEETATVASSLIHRGLLEAPYLVFFGFAGYLSATGSTTSSDDQLKYFIKDAPELKQEVALFRHFSNESASNSLIPLSLRIPRNYSVAYWYGAVKPLKYLFIRC